MDQWDKIRRLVLARDGEKCLRCLAPAVDVHHRRPKGMGGTGNKYIALGMANLVSLCRDCHTEIHTQPELGYRTGFLLHSWEDPAEIPLVIKPGTFLVKLTPAGDMEVQGECLLF
jgi:5-methylcytosine-specific restriction protein A